MLNQIILEAVPVLTATPFQPILASLAHMQGGRGNPIRQGFNKPLSAVVFFCHSKIKAVSNRLYSVMAGLLLGNSKELPHLVAVFPPLLINPAAYVVENISSGLHPQTRTTAMNTSTGETTPQNQSLIYHLENIKSLSSYCSGSAISNALAFADIQKAAIAALEILSGNKKPA